MKLIFGSEATTSSPYTYLTTHLLKYCTEEGPGTAEPIERSIGGWHPDWGARCFARVSRGIAPKTPGNGCVGEVSRPR